MRSAYSLMVLSVLPYTREQNGLAEQKHNHILKTTRAQLISSYISRSFWTEAILTFVNLINITQLFVLAGKSPHEHLYSSPPDYSMLRMFECTCYVLPPIERTKLSADQLSASYSALVLSTRVVTAIIH